MYYNHYLPVEGDIILGIVVDKSSSHLLIDCKAKKLAKLLIMNSERDLFSSSRIAYKLERFCVAGYRKLETCTLH